MNPDRLPPQNREAERSVLGSLLRDNGVIGDVFEVLRPEHFYQDAHQKIAAAMFDIYGDGKPVDVVVLAEELHRRKQIKDVGDYAYLGELWDAAPTAANVGYYAGIVRERHLTRSLIHAGTVILRDAYDQVRPGGELLEEASKAIHAIEQGHTAGEIEPFAAVVDEVSDRIDTRIERRKDGQPATDGLATGFKQLDMLTCGLQKGELIVLAARPSVGKTALAGNIASYVAAECKQPVLFVSLEQSRHELTERLMAGLARVDSQRLRKGLVEQIELNRLAFAADVLRAAPLRIDDYAQQSVLGITSKARRLQSRSGLALVVIDYLQLILPDSRREPRHEQVAAISRRLKMAARELHVPVLALAQLNRASEDRHDKRPRLADLRESGSIEADADTVLLLHRDESHPGLVECIIAKQRNGPTDSAALCFEKEFVRFTDAGTPAHTPFDPRS